MYAVVIVICTLIFIAWLLYEQRKAQRADQIASEEFWVREEEANQARNKDISHLPRITVRESEIPTADTSDEAINYYIGQIKQIIKEPLMDLSEYSNTDLKLAYGVGNFKTLSDYDENFNSFLMNLSNLARSYQAAGFHEKARDTYLLALQYGSFKLSDFSELAKVYLSMDQPENITGLISELEAGTHPRKDTVIQGLCDILASYQ
ncbi:MAG: hypothetical protein J1F22_08255 [Lachnospiraceae bacterium]|nr:hypothetical protein [Lachnospiraceae bacterium]